MDDSQRKSRESTRLRGVTASRLGCSKVVVDIDPQTGRTSGPNRAQFASYLGVLARMKVFILLLTWDHVTEAEKNIIC